MNMDILKEKFIEVFEGGDGEIRIFHAPGRVNLIGEHTDYNGGCVLPCALNFGTYAAARKREDNIIRLVSLNFNLEVSISLDDIQFEKAHDWADYPKGIINEFINKGFSIGGFEVLYYGSIPSGAGLSSSASIELVTSVMIEGLFNCDIDMMDMVRLSQRAENSFVGVNCGIMDQFASGMGLKGHAMFLNCSKMEFEYVPIALQGYKIIITNTNKRRGLADSKYNERRSQCEKALEYLNKELKINFLGELDADKFEIYKYLIEDEICKKRAEHVVYEGDRVLRAVDTLRSGDLYALGKLMNESHISLRDLYEVTGNELDTLVEEAWKIDGCIGSRMTGAGFGGCTVSIVKDNAVEEFIDKVGRNYKEKTGLKADFYIAETGDGAGEIRNGVWGLPPTAPLIWGNTSACPRVWTSKKEVCPLTLIPKRGGVSPNINEAYMDTINAAFEIERLLRFGLKSNMIGKLDVIPVRNALLELLKLKEPYEGEVPEESLKSPAGILDRLLDYAAEEGILPCNTISYRELLDAKLMGLLMPRQSEVSQRFWRDTEEAGIEKATDKFYKLSQDSNYIRMDRIAKNLYWTGGTEYGSLEITVNLSKPEKDPKEIEAAKNQPQSNYPKCLLCLENVGYSGNLNHPARQNHRVIPLTLDGEEWYFQYSPYVYYNEHCIVFHEKHIPMKISEKTFKRLFDFIELFPHYFIGSNADFPIVGGSILVHEHFQGGRHIFPVEKAPVEKEFFHSDFEGVKVGIVKWPMSVIRLSSNDKDKVFETAVMILRKWREYSDESVNLFAFTFDSDNKTPHNTITPIARKNSFGELELDLVLRNNRTSKDHPDGIFHPHRELHHIKKENIGLIEVMGLAVLPGRLNEEIVEIVSILTGECSDVGKVFKESAHLVKHCDWIHSLIKKYGTKLKKEEAMEYLRKEVANKFLQVLLDCGVFKRDKLGRNAFVKFMESMSFIQVETD